MQILVQGDVNSELALPLEEEHYHFIRPATITNNESRMTNGDTILSAYICLGIRMSHLPAHREIKRSATPQAAIAEKFWITSGLAQLRGVFFWYPTFCGPHPRAQSRQPNLSRLQIFLMVRCRTRVSDATSASERRESEKP